MASGPSFHSSLLRGMVLVAGGAIIVLAVAAIWFTDYLSKDLTAWRVHQTLERVVQRVDMLTKDAMRLSVLAARRLDPARPLAEQMGPLVCELEDVLELCPDVAGIGLGVEATGDYTILLRVPEPGWSLNREGSSLPDGSHTVRQYKVQKQQRRLDRVVEWDGYDPRRRPFYRAAKVAGCATWTEAYPLGTGPGQSTNAGISYVCPVFNPQSNLVGVIEIVIDLKRLSDSLSELTRDTRGYSFIIEDHDDGGSALVAYPDASRLTDLGDRSSSTKVAAQGDPVVRAVLQRVLPRAEPVPHFSAPKIVTADGARYFLGMRRVGRADPPRWWVVTVLPVAVVVRETSPVYLWLGTAAVLLLLLSWALAGRVASRVARPLRQLEEQLARQSLWDGAELVVLTGAREFRHLGDAINRLIRGLAERRAELVESNRQLQAQIEHRRLAEEALRDSREKFQKAFEDSPDAVVLATLEEGRYLEVNESFCRLFGYTREEALQRTSAEVLYIDPDQRKTVLELVRRQGHLRDYEMRSHRKDGTEFEASLSIERITIQGRPHLLGIARDITQSKQAAAELERHRDHLEELVRERTAELSRTNLVLATEVHERKRVEEELRSANERLKELDRLKSEFLATMSHELRTPLNSIIGFTGILRQRLAGPLTAEQEKQLGMVQGSARHLLGLINDLLDLSRIESGKMELHYTRFGVGLLVREVVKTLEPLAALKRLPLRVELEEPNLEMNSDRKKIFQILLNLVNNAVKFTEQGEVFIRVEVQAGTVRFTVRDTGIGIKPEHLALLFEAFRQVDGSARRVYEGTGLGLYLCRKLVGLLGGHISAQSDFGHGSEFCFTVPARPEKPLAL